LPVSVVPGAILFVPVAITYWEGHVGVGSGVGVGDAVAPGVRVKAGNAQMPKNRLMPNLLARFTIAAYRT
jgi:hypothetical protein